MTTLIARSAHIPFGFLLLTFLQACTSGGGDGVSPLQAPTIDPIVQAAGSPAGELTAEEGELLTFTVNASNDGPTPALSVTGLPPGADFDTVIGEFNWIPADGDAERGPFEVTFTATDPIETGLSTNQTVIITVLPFGSGTFTAIPPVIEPNGGAFLASVTVSMSTASDGATIFYTLDGSDPTESSNQYAEPFQLTADAVVNARAFRGDLNNSNLSRAIFTVTPNAPPVLNPIGNKTAIEDQNLSFTVTATDADGDAGLAPVLRVGDLPPGATFDPATGEFSWTPEPGAMANSPYSVTFTATDGDNPFLVDTETISITVNNESPVLSAIGDRSVAENQALSFTVSATDAESTTPVLSATGLPTGAVFDPATGLFSWTPAAGTASGSPYSVTFTATDAVDPNLTDSETIQITVGNDAPVLNPIGNQTTVESQALTFTVSASDTETTPVLSSSALPPGALFSPETGVFNWVPGPGAAVNSPYSVTFTATDAVDPTLTASETIAITVTSLVVPPPATVATPTISPPGGPFDESVSVTITTATPGATIRYTLDSSDPTSLSAVYSAPLNVTVDGTVVSARAFQAGFTNSERATSAPFTKNVATASCTTAITSPTALDLQTSTDLVISATFTCDSAIPAGWGVRLDAVGVNNDATATEVVRVSPYTRTFSLPKDEYTVSATVVDDLDSPVANAVQAQVTPVGIGDYYVAIGDSITAGDTSVDVRDSFASSDGRNTGGYPARLNDLLTAEQDYPHTVVNQGQSGELSAGGRSRIAGVLDAHPDAQRVLVMYGMNDARPSLPLPIPPTGPGSYKENMQGIINAIRDAGMEPVLAQVNIARSDQADDDPDDYYDDPDTGARSVNIKAFNQVVRDLADENGLSIAPPDFYQLYLPGRRYEDEYGDAIHPNSDGYQRMARSWSNALVR